VFNRREGKRGGNIVPSERISKSLIRTSCDIGKESRKGNLGIQDGSHRSKLTDRWARVGVDREAQGAEVSRVEQEGEQSGGSLATDRVEGGNHYHYQIRCHELPLGSSWYLTVAWHGRRWTSNTQSSIALILQSPISYIHLLFLRYGMSGPLTTSLFPSLNVQDMIAISRLSRRLYAIYRSTFPGFGGYKTAVLQAPRGLSSKGPWRYLLPLYLSTCSRGSCHTSARHDKAVCQICHRNGCQRHC
jgi:hypothetical protein